MELPELEPLEPELEPEPMLPLLDPLDGVLGEGVELGEVVLLLPLAPVPALDPVLGELEELGALGEVVLLLPLAPEPDLLKYASHSWRDTCPSPFLSTDEKLGADELELPDIPPLEPEVALPPDAALPPEDDAPDEDGVLELAPLEPDAAGDEELEDDGVLALEPLELEPEAAGADDDDDLSALPELLDEELCASVAPDSANSAAAVAALRTLSFNIGDTSLQGV